MSPNVIELVDFFVTFAKRNTQSPPWDSWERFGRQKVIEVLREVLNRPGNLINYRLFVKFGYIFEYILYKQKELFDESEAILIKGAKRFCHWWGRLAPNGSEIPTEEWNDLLVEGWALAKTLLAEGFKSLGMGPNSDDPRFDDYIRRFHERCNVLGNTKYPAIGDRSNL